MNGNGYVVANPIRREGVGNRLLLLGEAVWLGRELGRAVIVDWRDTVFLKDTALNYFTEVFTPLPEIVGVRMDYAPSPGIREYEQSRQGERLKLKPDNIVARLGSEPGSAPRYILASRSLVLHRLPAYDAASYQSFLEAFYRQIVPRPDVAEQLEAWYGANLRGHFVVGVNVSTGNGQFAKDARFEGRVNVRIFDNEKRFLRMIAAACERATKDLLPTLRSDCRIFFATDSAQMAEVLGRLPRAVTRRTVFPPPGVGRHFCDYDALGYSDRAAAADTVIDMLLLARCNALIRNRSKFSSYALVSTGYFGGNVQEVEELYPKARARTNLRRIRALGRRVAARATRHVR
jgi:hypothetical protein